MSKSNTEIPQSELAPLSLRPVAGDLAGAGRSHFHGTVEERRAHGRALAARRALFSGLGKQVLRAIEAAGYKVVPADNGDGS